MSKDIKSGIHRFSTKHPIVVNVVIILLIAISGILIAYLSLALFTKHGQKDQVPNVVGMSYTQAIEKLHDYGFKIEIKDSLYLDNVKPGYVIEQFPGAENTVKPGRKIFLYINAVYPKQMVIDPSSNNPDALALENFSLRQAQAMLEEAGFKNVKIVYKRGLTDRVVRVMANGKVVKVMEKVPVNANIVLEVYDNSAHAITDSLQNSMLWLENQIDESNESDDYPEDNDRASSHPTPQEEPTESENYEIE